MNVTINVDFENVPYLQRFKDALPEGARNGILSVFLVIHDARLFWDIKLSNGRTHRLPTRGEISPAHVAHLCLEAP